MTGEDNVNLLNTRAPDVQIILSHKLVVGKKWEKRSNSLLVNNNWTNRQDQELIKCDTKSNKISHFIEHEISTAERIQNNRNLFLTTIKRIGKLKTQGAILNPIKFHTPSSIKFHRRTHSEREMRATTEFSSWQQLKNWQA